MAVPSESETLLSDKADLSDPALTNAFRKYFDRTSPLSNRVEYCGIALVGFDADFYPEERCVADDIASAARKEIEVWSANVGRRLSAEKLEHFEVQFFCIPLPSVDDFRSNFLEALGIAT